MFRYFSTMIKISAIALPLLAGCAATRRVSMNTIRPADVALSQDIKTILLIDRTRFKRGVVNIIEGALTGELPMEDRAAVQDGLSTMREMLMTTDRFHSVIDPGSFIGNSLTSVFPDPMPWSRVKRLCRQHDAQALLAIEIFDTDFIVTESKKKIKKRVKEHDESVEKEIREYHAEGVMNLKMGIRLYDNLHQEIVDEELYSKTRTWKSKADSKARALAKLIRKADASRALASRLCRKYTYRIAPQPIRITRSFYKKYGKCPSIEKGTRYADVNNWDRAIEIWEEGIGTAPRKQAGFLAYNIAVGYEVLGDYETALKWAQDAYTEYGNNKAQSYVSTLRHRINSEMRVDEQMGGEE
jgi:hypothetical protein